MVFTYYLSLIPYALAWHVAKLLRRKQLTVIHVEDAFDYFLFGSIAKYLKHLDIVVSSATIIPNLKPMLKAKTKIYQYPFCFPDAVLMFRNAAWKYPVSRITKIGLQHGAYSFKRLPKVSYFNMFNLYLLTSPLDENRLKAQGAKTVKAIGYPKSDALFDNTYNAESLNNLKAELNIDNAKPTVLFSATWDGSGMSAIDKWYNKLDTITDSYNILVTLHPWISDIYRSQIENQPGIHYIKTSDLYHYLLIADVFVCDTSSLIAEFCIVNRPIITFRIAPTKRTIDDVIELIASVSIRINSFAELPAAITKALATAAETAFQRSQAIKTLIDPLDGKAGKRAAAEITNLIPELKL